MRSHFGKSERINAQCGVDTEKFLLEPNDYGKTGE